MNGEKLPENWIWRGLAILLLVAVVVGVALIVNCRQRPKPEPAPTPAATAAAVVTALPGETATLGPAADLPALQPPVAGTGGLLSGRCHARGPLPDPSCTPGATDARVTQTNIQQTVCVSGYTKTVRPPVSVTEPIKRERMAAYGVSGPESSYELDHLIPLELGGDPRSLANLWPEAATPTPGFHEKDRFENALHEQVCSGALPLAEAQRRISTDWLSYWQQAGMP